MPGALPKYDGVYSRLFIAPTVIIGLGRWGNDVCAEFFHDVLPTLASAPSIAGCFSRLAWVRHLDLDRPGLGWASEKQSWPSELDAGDPERFSDVTGENQIVSFWSTPRSCFRSALEKQWDDLAPKLKKLLEGVSSKSWREDCEKLGLKVPAELESTDRWIVTVGSLFEPEVGVIIADIERFVQQTVRAGAAGCKFLHILDAGLPPDPAQQSETWVTCPGSLQAQLLSSFDEFGTSENAIFFYCTSTDRAGYRVGVAERISSAAGVLRSYFTGSLLSPHDRDYIHSSIFKSPTEPRAVTPDRTAVFMEFALDLDNLGELIAHELLARWKRRYYVATAALTDIKELRKKFNEGLKLFPDEGRELFRDVAQRWFESTGVNPDQCRILEELKDWITTEKEKLWEDIKRDSAASEIAVVPASSVCKRLIKAMWALGKRPRVIPAVSRPESRKKQLKFTDEVITNLTGLITVMNDIAKLESAFQDIRLDSHLEIQQVTPSTLVAKYKRLPKDSACPAHIREFISSIEKEIPKMLWRAIAIDPVTAFSESFQRIRKRWRQEISPEKPDDRWSKRGIVQWIRHDALLSKQLAAYATRKLVPLWKPYAYRTDNWTGFLTIFDYGVDLSSKPRPESAEALLSLKKAFVGPESQATMQFGVSKHPYASALKDVYWERWPSMYSFGLLWTDTAQQGKGFFADWDAQELLTNANGWKDTNAVESAWICSPPREDFLTPGTEN